MNNDYLMTVATSKRPIERKASPKKTSPSKPQSSLSAIQSSLSNSKLIQNLGSSNNGIQFNIDGDLRTAYGRD